MLQFELVSKKISRATRKFSIFVSLWLLFAVCAAFSTFWLIDSTVKERCKTEGKIERKMDFKARSGVQSKCYCCKVQQNRLTLFRHLFAFSCIFVTFAFQMTLNYPLLTDFVDCRRSAADPEVKESEIDFSCTCYRAIRLAYVSRKTDSQCIT